MKRIIAIDYGDARTGVAVSDLTGTFAGEALTIQEWNAEKLAQRSERILGILSSVKNKSYRRV